MYFIIKLYYYDLLLKNSRINSIPFQLQIIWLTIFFLSLCLFIFFFIIYEMKMYFYVAWKLCRGTKKIYDDMQNIVHLKFSRRICKMQFRCHLMYNITSVVHITYSTLREMKIIKYSYL